MDARTRTSTIQWWEARRPAFNVLVGLTLFPAGLAVLVKLAMMVLSVFQ